MMSSPKVSVIVAAYNAEKYLARCLDSLAAQSFRDFEVIIVDDGSKDRTAEIADSFISRDSRFRVIHQSNSGVAVARQAGLDSSKGKYTIHVDSDDWIDPCMLEHLVLCAAGENADVVICDFTVHLADDRTEIWRQDPGSLDHWNVLGRTFHDLHGSLCNKLIKKECYTSNKVRISEELYACEDLWVVLSLLSRPLKIAYLGEALYHYDQSQNNASYVNANPLIKERLSVLEKYASTFDVAPVISHYDKALLHLAYDALFYTREQVPDYKGLFGKHRKSLLKANGFPFHVKFSVFLGTLGIRLPLFRLKHLSHHRPETASSES